MSGGIEAAGDILTGGVIAHAVEPHAHASARAGGDHVEGLCLNCGTKLIGAHCHTCGQAAHVHRTIGALGLMYPYKPGDDIEAQIRRSFAIRDALATRIASRNALVHG